MVYMTNIYNSKWHIVNIFFQIESKSVYGKSSQFTSLALAVYSMIKSPSIFFLFKCANEKPNDTHGYLISTYNVIPIKTSKFLTSEVQLAHSILHSVSL